MDTAVVEQLLDELLSSLEELETKATATLRYLKEKGNATEEDLAPYLEQAGNASNVRRRATRLRMMSLLSSALKSVGQEKKESKGSKESAEKEKPSSKAERTTKPQPPGQEIPDELVQATGQAETASSTGQLQTKDEKSSQDASSQGEQSQSAPPEQNSHPADANATAPKPEDTKKSDESVPSKEAPQASPRSKEDAA
jgi:hypothetical protein